jgi:hypothetical protein
VNPLAVEVKPMAAAVDPLNGTVAALVAADNGDGLTGSRAIGAIRIPKGVVVAAGAEDEAVQFAIKPVALADAQDGSFGKLERMSTPITMVPDREVTIDGDIGIEFDLCIGDSAAQTNATKCKNVLARLRPMSSQDLNANVSDAKEVYGGCRKGTSCGCSCAFTTPHLTSFVVTDPGIEVAGEVTADALEAGVEVLVGSVTALAPTPAPAGPSSGGGGSDLPLVPIAAACGAVALLALAIVARRKRMLGARRSDARRAWGPHGAGQAGAAANGATRATANPVSTWGNAQQLPSMWDVYGDKEPKQGDHDNEHSNPMRQESERM